MSVSKVTCDHFNALLRNPGSLERQLSADFNRILGSITPPRTLEEADEVVRKDWEGAQASERG